MCTHHGGKAPQVLAKARENLALAADHNRSNVQRLADTAESEQVRLSAANSLLDRAGVSAKTAVDVSVELKPHEELLRDIAASGIAQISRAESRAARGLPALDRADPAGIVDAEVVDVAEMGPDSATASRTPADRSDDPRDRPAFAEDPPTPGTGLMTVEDAVAELRVHHVRRVR